MDNFFGEVISSYTEDQAIADGVLVYPYPDKFPNLLLTNSVYAAISAVDDGRTLDQKMLPFIVDVIMAGMVEAEKETDSLYVLSLPGNITGQADIWMSENTLGGFTILFPEDY